MPIKRLIRNVNTAHTFFFILLVVCLLVIISLVQISAEKKEWLGYRTKLEVAINYIANGMNYKEAEPYLEDLISEKKNEDDYYVLWLLAETKLKLSELDDAEYYYKQILKINPFLINVDSYLEQYGVLKYSKEEYGEAELYLVKAKEQYVKQENKEKIDRVDSILEKIYEAEGDAR